VVDVGGDKFRVSEGFRPFMTWKKSQRHVSQNRLVAADYTKHEFEYPVIFEFFLLLTNETALRTTLDALFFKENIEAKLKAIGIDEVAQHLIRNDVRPKMRTSNERPPGSATISAATPSSKANRHS
jgi:hypothetical protein